MGLVKPDALERYKTHKGFPRLSVGGKEKSLTCNAFKYVGLITMLKEFLYFLKKLPENLKLCNLL